VQILGVTLKTKGTRQDYRQALEKDNIHTENGETDTKRTRDI
jgi:hypothetical protein